MRRVAWLLLLIGCSGAPATESTGNLFLAAVADQVILPTLAGTSSTAGELAAQLRSACAQLDEGKLVAAQLAWRQARRMLKKAEAFSFGPSDDLRLEAAMDFWPVRIEDLDEELAGDAPVTIEVVRARGASRKGLPAIEYLIFDPMGEQAAVINRLSARNGRGCAYAVAIAAVYAEDAEQLRSAWAPEGGNFREELVAAGETPAKVYADSRAAVGIVVNQMIATLGTLESMKLAKPLGRQTGGVPQLGLVESRFSGNGVADLEANVAGVRAIYRAKPSAGPSLSEFVASRAAETDREMSTSFTDLEAALGAIDRPLDEAISTQPELVTAAFLEAQSAHRQLAGPVAGALGVTVSFSDADGD